MGHVLLLLIGWILILLTGLGIGSATFSKFRHVLSYIIVAMVISIVVYGITVAVLLFVLDNLFDHHVELARIIVSVLTLGLTTFVSLKLSQKLIKGLIN